MRHFEVNAGSLLFPTVAVTTSPKELIDDSGVDNTLLGLIPAAMVKICALARRTRGGSVVRSSEFEGA